MMENEDFECHRLPRGLQDDAPWSEADIYYGPYRLTPAERMDINREDRRLPNESVGAWATE